MATRAMETFGGLIGLVFLSLMMMAKAQTCPGGVEEIPYNSGPKPKMLIGIGTPRSGSTLLFNKLAGHPQIIPSYSKATHFFDRPGLELSGDSFNEYLRNWGVQDLLEMLVEGNVLMEFTPSYLSVRLPDHVAPVRSIRQSPMHYFAKCFHRKQPLGLGLCSVNCSIRESLKVDQSA